MNNETKITIVNGNLHVENAHITFKNFEGRSDQYNMNGAKSFALVVPEEFVDMLQANGWKLRIKPDTRGEGDFVTLKVKVKFNNQGPGVYLNSVGRATKLNDATVGMLDHIRMTNIAMIIRPYDWALNGNSGRTAYLQAMEAEQIIDAISAKYQAQEYAQPVDVDVQDPSMIENF